MAASGCPSQNGQTDVNSIADGNRRTLRILGTRGVPAKHGGFETFADHFSRYMVEEGWEVHVYCQETGFGKIRYASYHGVRTVHVPSGPDSPIGTFIFDFRSVLHSAIRRGVCLTLGYNTAVMCAFLRLTRRKAAINMDGIEWKRQKWSLPMRAWLLCNEWLGARLNHLLIADHPEIARHLSRHTNPSKIRMIPYGAEPAPPVDDEAAILAKFGLHPRQFAIVIARSEPENSILEIVQAWSKRNRGIKLVVLGKYMEDVPYHCEVKAAANSAEVIFPGAIYSPEIIAALRRNATLYIHGHQVGGTNPSLVEALSYGNPVLAHDNRFNRWVAGPHALYFASVDQCDEALARLVSDSGLIDKLSQCSKDRHSQDFRFEQIHQQYRQALEELTVG